MKQIVLLFFTFLGICNGFSQKSEGNDVPDSQLSVIKPFGRLFPNPAIHKVEIELKGFEAGILQLQIIDTKGHRFRNDERLLFIGNEMITVMFDLQPGLYFLLLKQKESMVKLKLVVQ